MIRIFSFLTLFSLGSLASGQNAIELPIQSARSLMPKDRLLPQSSFRSLSKNRYQIIGVGHANTSAQFTLCDMLGRVFFSSATMVDENERITITIPRAKSASNLFTLRIMIGATTLVKKLTLKP